MHSPELHTKSSDSTPPRAVVWDIPVRLFHWLLVISVFIAAVTGFLAPQWWLDIHLWAGYAIALLIAFRLIWGFAGSYYARFRNFIFPARTTLAHLREITARKPTHYTGHNPAGALMIFLLLGALGTLVATGLITLGGQENQGILAGFAGFQAGRLSAKIHEGAAVVLLVMIAGHLAGVVFESFRSRENLARAMITGRKKSGTHYNPVSSIRGGLIAAILTLIGVSSSYALLRIPPSGFVAMPVNADYQTECGDCHVVYHPSLLPAASWSRIMADLGNHFGEDASLDEATASEINAYLQRWSSERWDSEAANRLRRVSTANPLRITETPFWKHRHKNIDPQIFKRKSIQTKINCNACHSDAETGHFADQQIVIPPA